jgi:hypothetical protein
MMMYITTLHVVSRGTHVALGGGARGELSG